MSDHKHTAEAEPNAGVDEVLRALPELPPPARVWDRVRDRLDAPRPARQRRFAPLAAAAGIVAVAAASVFLAFGPRSTQPADFETALPDIATLLERSALVEAQRRAMPAVFAPSGVERVLQVRIGGIDAELNEQLLRGADPNARRALLHERVELMEDLRHLERYRRDELFRQAMF